MQSVQWWATENPLLGRPKNAEPDGAGGTRTILSPASLSKWPPRNEELERRLNEIIEEATKGLLPCETVAPFSGNDATMAR